MGVLRFPRPTGIYIPQSSSSTLTTDMISPPLSPSVHWDSETVTPSIIPALEYISSKLQQKMVHVTLLVGRGTPYPTHPTSDQLMVIPVTSLEEASWGLLYRIVAKAGRKFALGSSWTDALIRSQHELHVHWYLIQQSIRQNEVLFSSEGLTLLNMDRIYTFKRRLCILSHRSTSVSEDDNDPYVTSCVQLLHRTIADFQGRPFSKAFFHRVYEQLGVRDDLLARVARLYHAQYEQEGIVLPRPTHQEHSQKNTTSTNNGNSHTSIRSRRLPVRPVRRRGPPPTASNSPKQSKRGPKTPVSASDVTPITRNEWNLLVGGERCWAKATVTKWTPSPTVLAAA